MEAVLISAKVPPELAEAIKRRALEADRSVSAEIRRALRSHFTAPEASTLTSEAAPPGGSAKTVEDGDRARGA